MAIHNLGYRHCEGQRGSHRTRWLVLTENGIRRAWASAWLRRMLFFAWLPSVLMGFMIFLYEQSESTDDPFTRAFIQMGTALLEPGGQGNMQPSGMLGFLREKDDHPGETRHLFWSSLLLTLFRRSQPFILIPMLGVITPPMVSQDIRSRAFLLYFSRPLSRTQYIVGKLATVIFYVLLITLMPALMLFCTGLLLSPDLSVLTSTGDLPGRILLASLLIAVPAASLSLMLSSLTTESRFAGFAWFSIWIFGAFTAAILSNSTWGDASSPLKYLSLFEVFSEVAGSILDPQLASSNLEEPVSILAVITAVSLAVLFRRISAPMQV